MKTRLAPWETLGLEQAKQHYEATYGEKKV